jgi:hypothetical protein
MLSRLEPAATDELGRIAAPTRCRSRVHRCSYRLWLSGRQTALWFGDNASKYRAHQRPRADIRAINASDLAWSPNAGLEVGHKLFLERHLPDSYSP